MLVPFAVINAALWGGVIMFLLFRAMRQQTGIDDRLRDMEGEVGQSDVPQNRGDT